MIWMTAKKGTNLSSMAVVIPSISSKKKTERFKGTFVYKGFPWNVEPWNVEIATFAKSMGNKFQ